MTMAIPPLPTDPKPYLKAETQDFLQYYNVREVKTASEERSYMTSSYDDWLRDSITNDIDATVYMRHLHTQRLVTLKLPQSSLDTIVANDAAFKHLMRQLSPYDQEANMEREHYLKRTNAGVRKAWDHYQLMLKLAWEGRDVDGN